jgi:uncharacterized membrane protein YhaH (DUF805 family)
MATLPSMFYLYTRESKEKYSMDNSSSGVLAGAFLIYAIIGLGIFIFVMFLLWRIFSKTGYSGAMSLLALIPFVGTLIVLLVLAFGDWPALRELNMLRQQRGMMPPGYPQGPQGPYAPNPQYPPNQPYPGNPPYPSGPQYPQM